jgi:hypothetical protein
LISHVSKHTLVHSLLQSSSVLALFDAGRSRFA